jgi:hypothetical protein
MRKEILMTVLTYPHPSEKYDELICTAGISDGQWIRLYPMAYRNLPNDVRFRKYQWITVDVQRPKAHQDKRPESWRPDLGTLEIGEHIDTAKQWLRRREIVDKLPHHTLNQLKESYDKDLTSLGIVRPAEILDLNIEKVERNWKPKWQARFDQLNLFEQHKRLTKIPYKFSYVFTCEDSDKPHKAMIEDWELGVLFLKEVENKGSEEAAVESVRNKFLSELCQTDNDTRFYMGTRWPFNTWMVLGVFYPPKATLTLF